MKSVSKFIIDNKLYLLSIIIFISYLLGFYFNEDSAGGGELDFAHEWKTFLEFEKGIYLALTSMNYESSRTPLFPILNSFNIFATDQYSLRLSNFIANTFIFFSFILCVKLRFLNFTNSLIILASSLILLSPYFRTSSYWAHQENLPYLFVFLSLSLIYYFKNNNKKISENIYATFVLAIISSLAFYSDQKFIFLSFFSFIYLFFETKASNKRIKIFLIYFLTSLPAFYLFYIWEGILPIESQEKRIGFYPYNISASLSILNFYFIPIILFLLLNNKFLNYFKNINKLDILIFSIIGIINYLCLPEFNSSLGYGIIGKFFYVLKNKILINVLIVNFFYFIFVQLFSFYVYLLLKKNYLNYLPIVIVILLTLFVERTYNEYFDPLVLILILIYFEFDDFLQKNQDKLIFYYLYFYCGLLFMANIYYNFYNMNPNP